MDELDLDDYVEMNVDEMKDVKETWKKYSKTIQRKLKHVKNVEETKDNRWELLSLEKHYDYCLDAIKKILAIYSELINLGEDCDLEEDYFLKKIKEIQRIHNDLHIEINKKTIKALEFKYVKVSMFEQTINL